jgi:hypothetical protein
MYGIGMRNETILLVFFVLLWSFIVFCSMWLVVCDAGLPSILM